MEDSLSGPTNRYLNILEDATRDFSGLLQKVLEEVTLDNEALRNRNAELQTQIQALGDDNTQLKNKLQDAPDAQKHNELMSRLVELSDQVIRTKDDCSALESRNRALSEENKKLQASLAADAEKVTARSTQAAAEHREEVERLSRQLADVELRAKNEKADFVKGVEAKDKRIAQLEEQLARLEASKARLEISNKENARHVHVGVSPLGEQNQSSSELQAIYQSRYRELKKHYEVLQNKYDELRDVHLSSKDRFQATRQKWSGYKNRLRAWTATMNDLQSTAKKARASLGPSTPDLGGYKIKKTELIEELAVELRQIEEADDEDAQAYLPVLNKSIPLASEIPNLRSAGPLKSPDVNPFVEPLPPTRFRPPSPTMSEAPLSQHPEARLAELEGTENEQGRRQDLSSPSRPPLSSPSTTASVLPSGLTVKPEQIPGPVPRLYIPPDHPPSSPATTVAPTRPSEPSSSRSATRPINQLEAAYFVKPEPVDDADITMVGDSESDSTPKRPQSTRRKQDIRQTVLRKKAQEAAAAAAASSSPISAPPPATSILGKRKNQALDPQLSVPTTPSPASTTSNGAKGKEKVADYAQYKGRGRYAVNPTTTSAQPINAMYEVNPVQNNGLDYQYDAVVRNKKQRKQMDAVDCECCREYYEAVGNLPPRNAGPQWRSPSKNPKRCTVHDPQAEDTSDQRQREEEIQQHRKAIGRHRHDWVPMSTPPDYWHIGFPDTQQIRSINERADAHYEAKRAYVAQEAEKSDGRYRKKR